MSVQKSQAVIVIFKGPVSWTVTLNVMLSDMFKH